MLSDWITSHARVLLLKWKVIELFHLVASSYANLLEQTNVFTQEIGSTPTGLIWDINMAAVSLFWQLPLTWRKWCHVKKALLTIFTETTMHLVYPLPPPPHPHKKKYITVVSIFSLVLQSSQDKSKACSCKILGGKHGALWSQWKWSIASRLFLVQMCC